MAALIHDEIVGQVISRADERGLLAHYCRDARRCEGDRGFPDLIIAGQRDVLAAEIKTAGGDTTAEQDLWLWMLARKIRVVVWTQRDLETGVVDQVLDQIA